MKGTSFPDQKTDAGRSALLQGRSLLLSSLFDYLNALQIPFCVLNNYAELPWVIPTDVDMVISEDGFASLDTIMANFADQTGTKIVQRFWSGYKQCAYVFATQGPHVEFVQFDFCVDFSFNGMPCLLSNKKLLEGRRPLQNFWIPSLSSELAFLTIRRVFKNDWSEKHFLQVAQLTQNNRAHFHFPAGYTWLQDVASLARKSDEVALASRRDRDMKRLRQLAAKQVPPWRRARIALWQTWRLARRLSEESGNLSVLAFSDADMLAEDVVRDLDIAFHRELILSQNSVSKIGWASLACVAVSVKALKVRKGLVLVQAGVQGSSSDRIARFLGKLGLVDQVFVSAKTHDERNQLKASVITVEDSRDVIEGIIDSQTERTKRVMARGFSQMSGRTVE